MEKHVTSLEISKKLKAAGIEQESEYFWFVHFEDEEPELQTKLYRDEKFEDRQYSAFLATELTPHLSPDMEIKVKDFTAEHIGELVGSRYE